MDGRISEQALEEEGQEEHAAEQADTADDDDDGGIDEVGSPEDSQVEQGLGIVAGASDEEQEKRGGSGTSGDGGGDLSVFADRRYGILEGNDE